MNTNTCQIKTINNENEVPTINIIAPKNSDEFSGTIAFFNNPTKNIDKFINIKTTSSTTKNSSHYKDKKIKSSFSLGEIPKRKKNEIKSKSINNSSSKNYNNKNIENINTSFIENGKVGSLKHRRVNSLSNVGKHILHPSPISPCISHKKQRDNTTPNCINISQHKESSILDTSSLANSSYISLNHLIISPSALSSKEGKIRATKQTKELLGKSYKLINNYQKRNINSFITKETSTQPKYKD